MPVNIQATCNQWSDVYDADRDVTRDLDHAMMRQTFRSLTKQGLHWSNCVRGGMRMMIGKSSHGWCRSCCANGEPDRRPDDESRVTR
ncbi:MAG: hypothetical protein RL211_991 [Pseudomonadota bacterium]|jgi:hypothetical protein